jgi:hypothetical protein
MTFEEFEKIVTICYACSVEVEMRRKKRVLVEKPITAEQALHLIAAEFGFELVPVPTEADK